MQTPYIRRFGLGQFDRPTTVLTSKVYPLAALNDGLESGGRGASGDFINFFKEEVVEAQSSSFERVTGAVRLVLKAYGMEEESLGAFMTGVSGGLRNTLKSYETEEESLDSSMSDVAGELRKILISYEEYEAEELNSNFLSISGELI